MRLKLFVALMLLPIAAGAAWAFNKPEQALGCCVTGDCCCPGQGSCCDPGAKAKETTVTATKAIGCCVTGNCCCPGQGSCCATAMVGTEAKDCCTKTEVSVTAVSQ
jgi:hypothetical protein